MSIEKRVEKLRCLITCMKCEVSGKVCDENCPTQYDAGNMGEIIENLEEIAKALEQEPKSEWEHDHEILRAYADGANNVLDKLRAEIDKLYEREGSSFDRLNALDELKEFIDKYKAETENP